MRMIFYRKQFCYNYNDNNNIDDVDDVDFDKENI